MTWMGSDAWAQTAGAPGSTNPMTAMLVQLGYFLPIFVIIYLIAIHPQRQRQKQLDKMIKELKKGDKVLTSGGIIGTVIGLDDSRRCCGSPRTPRSSSRRARSCRCWPPETPSNVDPRRPSLR